MQFKYCIYKIFYSKLTGLQSTYYGYACVFVCCQFMTGHQNCNHLHEYQIAYTFVINFKLNFEYPRSNSDMYG